MTSLPSQKGASLPALAFPCCGLLALHAQGASDASEHLGW